jgi:hypothetical protein
MRFRFKNFVSLAAFVFGALLSAASFGAVVQVLDSVDAYGRNASDSSSALLEMGFRDPPPRADFSRLAIGATTGLIACQRAADQGLYCLDGPIVRYWPDTGDLVATANGSVVPDIDLIDCRRIPGLDTRKPNPCTGVTVDLNGSIWLAGRKANTHSLFKVVQKPKDSSCVSPWVELPAVKQDLPNTVDTPADKDQVAPTYCAREYAFGRPVLVDINPVDGEVAASFTGTGIIGLEERKTAVFFPDALDSSGNPVQPVEIASGKTEWSLIGNEQLLSASFLQIQATASLPLQNFVLVTTTLGRVLATKADGSGVGFKVWDIPACTVNATQNYGIRVSSQSERVYLTDRACQKVYALKWSNVADGDFDLVPEVEGAGSTPVVLKTVSADSPATTSVFPDGLSVAPGIGIDLRDCSVGKVCTIVADGTDGNGFDAANISGVVLDGPQSGLTLFQVKGIPDCRYWPSAAQGAPLTTEQQLCSDYYHDVIRCDTSDEDRVVANVCPNADDQYLDIYWLLPEEIKLQLAPGPRPRLLISPRYRGQDANRDATDPDLPYAPTINLFFGIGEPGLQFRDTFRMSFDVGDLTDEVKWGCGGGTSVRPDLEWNVIITGSETYEVAHKLPDGSKVLANVETLVNDGCSNPDGVTSKRFSYYAYTMEVVPEGDGIYANLVRDLFDELLHAQQQTACRPYDGSVAPLDRDTTCVNLTSKWDGAYQKLDRCIVGSTYPRQSEAVNNCQSFLSQLGQYESALNASPRLGQDPANRIGELKARVKVLRYVFQQHFVPSIPPNGFCDLEGATCPQ